MDISRKKSEPQTQSPRLTLWQLALLATVLFVVILAIDLRLPLGIAAGVPYVAVVLLGWWFPKLSQILILAAISTALTLIGYFHSSEGNILWMVHVNRFLALFAIWVSAALLIAAKTATEALAKSEQRYMRLVDNTPAGIWQITPDGETVYINHALARMFELDDPEEAVGRFYTDFVTPDSAEKIDKQLPKRQEGSTSQYEVEIVGKKGGKCHALLTGSPLLSEDGEMIGRIATLIDITDRKTTEAQLLQAHKMEAIGNLTGGIAHDFNNILGIVLGNLQLLQRRLKDEVKLLRMIEAAIKATQRGADLTGRLLAFSRRQELDPLVLDINELVAGMEKILRRTLGEQIEIKTTFGDGLGRVKADPAQLESAILNLAINARDAMAGGGGGLLTIETENAELDKTYVAQHAFAKSGPHVCISVCDTGPGIPEDIREHIFEPFFTTKEVGKGSGLGLSMIFGFVKQSGGHINVYSEGGYGTQFRIYLPRTDEPSASLEAQEAGADDLPGGTETVLLVEDDEQFRQTATLLLEDLGYTVLGEPDGPRALESLEAHPEVDILFTDMVMPGGLNGYELAERTQELRPGLPVLLTSGYPRDAFSKGRRFLLLSKPYTDVSLAQSLRAVLDGRQEPEK